MSLPALYSPTVEYSGTSTSRIGFISLVILILFAFLRPLSISIHHIGSVNVLDAFGIASSYLMLMVLLVYFRRLELNTINILVFFYIFYCILSLAWGSKFRDISRILLPFIPFFIAQVLIRSEKQLRIVLGFMTLGYIVPILGSAVTIFLGLSPFDVDYHTGIVRYYGLSTGPHALSHIMLFFSFTLGLQSIVSKDFRLSLTIGLSVLFLASMYCIAMTNTRTVYLGFFIFWPLFLWSWKKKYFIVCFLLFLIVSSLFWGHVQKFLTRAERGVAETQTINYASSGRFSLWGHNIQVFESLPIWQKLMGVGFGNEQKPVVNAGTRQNVVSSHNDYLSLLMVSGIIGLLLYGLIQMAFLINILKSGIRRRLKLFFIALLLTVFAMNLVSNSYINRFPLAQLFWFYVGLFYSLSNMDRMRSRSAGI